jgi:2-aminobenzoate-CoA ligase
VSRIANVLTRDFGLVPGNRVLLRGPNNPMMVASILAVMKAGGVVVATMPLLRAKELSYAVGKARIALALCDARLADEMEKTRPLAPGLKQIVYWGDKSQGSLESLMMRPGYENFVACDTANDDVCLIGFTSGTTGEPKGTMHFHRDMLATCDTYGRHVLRPSADDRFIGSPPLAFTFGLAARSVSPARRRLHESCWRKRRRTNCCPRSPSGAPPSVSPRRPHIAPCSVQLAGHDISSLKKCVSAGEALPLPTFEAWHKATGIRIMDGIGATEMLHIFIGSPDDEIRAGSTGRAVPGYEAKVIDDAGHEMPPGIPGRLAVRGPTGCRYLADTRQTVYVQSAWNVTGDTYVMDKDRLLLVPGAFRRHDHFGRLQYRRAGSRDGAADASRRRRMRRRRGARRGARTRSSRLMSCCAPARPAAMP